MTRLNSAHSAKADRQATTACPSSVEACDPACAMVLLHSVEVQALPGTLSPHRGLGKAMTRQSAQDCARRPAGRSQRGGANALGAGACAAHGGVFRLRQLERQRSFAVAI